MPEQQGYSGTQHPLPDSERLEAESLSSMHTGGETPSQEADAQAVPRDNIHLSGDMSYKSHSDRMMLSFNT